MFLRIFIRTFFDYLFKNNFITDMFVKICNKNKHMSVKSLKKNAEGPITDTERNIFFQSFTGDTLDCNN